MIVARTTVRIELLAVGKSRHGSERAAVLTAGRRPAGCGAVDALPHDHHGLRAREIRAREDGRTWDAADVADALRLETAVGRRLGGQGAVDASRDREPGQGGGRGAGRPG